MTRSMLGKNKIWELAAFCLDEDWTTLSRNVNSQNRGAAKISMQFKEFLSTARSKWGMWCTHWRSQAPYFATQHIQGINKRKNAVWSTLVKKKKKNLLMQADLILWDIFWVILLSYDLKIYTVFWIHVLIFSLTRCGIDDPRLLTSSVRG